MMSYVTKKINCKKIMLVTSIFGGLSVLLPTFIKDYVKSKFPE